MFNRDLDSYADERELNKLHEQLKEQSIVVWEKAFPIHYPADKLLLGRDEIAKKLDSQFKATILPMWQKIHSDIDQKTRNAVENLIKRYEENMNRALSEMECNSEETIASAHEQFSREARTDFGYVSVPIHVNKKVYDDLLSSGLDNTLDRIRIENAQRSDTIRNHLLKEFLQFIENIEPEILNSNTFPERSAVMAYYEIQLNDLYEQLNRFKIPINLKEEVKSLGTEKLDEMISALWVKWDNIQPDPNQMQLAINTAVAEYNKEMENRTMKSGEIYNNKAMQLHHFDSLQIVRKKFAEMVKQTSRTRELFNEAVDGVLKKFEDLNDIRAAEYNEATVGIDLGTTFSCVAIYKGDTIEMIPDREHHSNTVPSYVFYESATKTVVGHSAKDQSIIYPQTTIFDSKRLIGRKFDDPQTQKDIAQWPFKVIRDPDVNRKEPKIEVHGKTFHPEEVSAEILKHLRKNAELYLDRVVSDVVITVPAYFNDAQKRATKNAAALANINVLEIMNEPTAAAVAYSLNYTDGKKKNILVFDLGGGTFDVSVLSTEKSNIQVKAVGGDNHLGGEDFDSNMVDFCIEKFRQITGLTIPKNVFGSLTTATSATDRGKKDEEARKVFEALRRLRQKCEMAKINLSKAERVRVVVDYIYDQKNMDVEITVEDFNQMNKHLFDKCITVVRDTVKEAKLSKAEIDDVVLVGGSSRIPEVQRLLSEFFNGKSLIMTLNPDEVVAQGAAYRAAMISGSKSRRLNAIKFQDVNPLSLGVEVIGQRFSIILPKNTPLPAERTETYVTTVDYQTSMQISIYEGEDRKIENNNLLGEFKLSGIPSKRRGQEPVDVTIRCDDEGLLHVSAKVKSNKNSEEIKIQSNRGGLTEEDIENATSQLKI
ncbi:heat shock 70 kDa protein-like [Bradysia coprophila]|uniref:heat shock 70 kDa protein-like n=1 Tax=Bradysia coprophila TaxID=38358 RepID=UPI00187DD9EA|nr:heat shock 70 kDa protein-like [Bradysia coprophila]